MISDRIQMIRVLYNSNIDVRVEDMNDKEGLPDGTLIVISFPRFLDPAR